MAKRCEVVVTGDDIQHLLNALNEAAEVREREALASPEGRLSCAVARKYRHMADSIEDSLPRG